MSDAVTREEWNEIIQFAPSGRVQVFVSEPLSLDRASVYGLISRLRQVLHEQPCGRCGHYFGNHLKGDPPSVTCLAHADGNGACNCPSFVELFPA